MIRWFYTLYTFNSAFVSQVGCISLFRHWSLTNVNAWSIVVPSPATQQHRTSLQPLTTARPTALCTGPTRTERETRRKAHRTGQGAKSGAMAKGYTFPNMVIDGSPAISQTWLISALPHYSGVRHHGGLHIVRRQE